MKKIKNTKTVILAAFVVVGSLFASCSSDDDNGNNEDTKEASIVGEWKIVTSVEETFDNDELVDKNETTWDDINYETFTFKDDGKFTRLEVVEDEEYDLELGSYTIDGNTLILTYGRDEDAEDLEVHEYEFTLSDDTLIIVYTYENPSIKFKEVTTSTLKRQ